MHRIGRYALLETIGEGGMAEVFRARLDGPMGFQKELAIKRIRDSVVREEGGEHVRSLINEARIGGLLKHPNIVEIYELGEDDGAYYIAMELVDGVSLSDVLMELRETGWLLPHNVVLEIAVQVCRGLSYAHAFEGEAEGPPGVVHRDLKPSNIMITRGGTAKIMDFGIAKSTSNLFNTTATGIAKGTPLYMSPEQLRGLRPLPVRSDLFSLGTILYEMVTGRLLFAGRTIPEIITRVLSMPLQEEIRAAEERLPGLGALLSRLLTRDIAHRFNSASDVAVELQHLLEWQEKRFSVAEFVQDFARGRYAPGGSGISDALDLETGGQTSDDDRPRRRRKDRPGSETIVSRYLAAQRRRRFSLMLAVLLLVGMIGAAGFYVYRGTVQVRLVVDQGRQALNSGDLAEARSAWRGVAGENPNRQEARFALAAISALDELDDTEVAQLLHDLGNAPEDTAAGYTRKYRAIAWVQRNAGHYRLAMKAQKDALDRARQAQRNEDAPIPPVLLWEAGELTLIREAPDAARAYFRELGELLPPGPQADAAMVYEQAIEAGNAPLLRAELLYLHGDDAAWEGLDRALSRAAGSRSRLREERLLWAFRALVDSRYQQALDLVQKVGGLSGEQEAKRQLATVRAAGYAGLGKEDLARTALDSAARAAGPGHARSASRAQVVLALGRSPKESTWRPELLDQLARDLGGDDPDVVWLRGMSLDEWPVERPAPFARARRLALDPRTGRLIRVGLVRGSPSGARLAPPEDYVVMNRTSEGLAWPFGPAWHPIDGLPLPILFHPGR